MNRDVSLHRYALDLAATQNWSGMVSTIEKELLHYEILDSLDSSGLLEGLVFQGGTSLRLCYGAERYSEDLDFSGGKGFDAGSLAELKECVEQAVGDRYHVDAAVKPPKKTSGLVSAWTVIVDTTPDRSDIPRQRIKIEVASIDAHDPGYRPLIVNYDRLPDTYADVMLNVESREEILADKIEAFVCSDHTRFRDLWDLAWLSKQPGIDMGKVCDLRELKAVDYAEIEKYAERFPMVGDKLSQAFDSKLFSSEMRRFLPAERVARTVERQAWLQGTKTQLMELFAAHAPARRRTVADFMNLVQEKKDSLLSDHDSMTPENEREKKNSRR
ncbi:nucleotidyl transferase AbiEii/AbiGii toxin family protein [Bifidobacterium biavatii]|uniref:Nucleotidyltransferase n=1 Tax=Bifidobacterium biavatii DSM 23969 TaxID=1437608 RepID=A0A086Z5W5_9BIFI|nr:nucleotidyl transferase AbiEii/AbiGii toxin family protein [Bifidobacterium biavatii]KFI41915.1 nucleotidyltransferase [Bifidobacterium biavatii DSM 23969]